MNVQQLSSPNVPATPLLEWNSNQVSLFKTPKYNLTSNVSTIDCLSTSPVSFSVNTSSPINLNTYNWSFGSNWSAIGNTNTSNLSLLSNNSTISPVSVTPYYCNVEQPIQTITINRTPFTSNASIIGNTVICQNSNSTYSINGVNSGNTVTWSVSNTSTASLSGASQNQVTVNGLSNGIVNLIATITNPCGQSVTKTKTINIGAPVLSQGIKQGELWVLKNFAPQTLAFPSVLGATSYNWVVSPDIDDFPLSCPPSGASTAKFSNNLQSITTTTPNVTARFGNCLGNYKVSCVVSNICGSNLAYELYVTVGNSGTSPCATKNTPKTYFKISQNPIKNESIIISKNKILSEDDFESNSQINSIFANDGPCYQEWPKVYNGFRKNNNLKTKLNNEIVVRIYNFYGVELFSKTINFENEEIILKDYKLAPGKYILHLDSGKSIQKEIIIVE